MSKLQAKQLENLTIEELMNLTTADVQKFQNLTLPKGIYSGTVGEWTMPTPEDANFRNVVNNVQVVEFDNEEDAEGFELPEDYVFNSSYNTGAGFQALVTNWGDFADEKFEGSIGTMIANSAGEEIVFRVAHRKSFNKETKETRIYTSITEVHAA